MTLKDLFKKKKNDLFKFMQQILGRARNGIEAGWLKILCLLTSSFLAA